MSKLYEHIALEYGFDEGDIVKHKFSKKKLYMADWLVGYVSVRCRCRDEELKEYILNPSELEKYKLND